MEEKLEMDIDRGSRDPDARCISREEGEGARRDGVGGASNRGGRAEVWKQPFTLQPR